MASALQQDWENYNPNNQTALRSPSYWDAVKENIPHQLTGLSRVGTNALGFPVDIVNLGLDATDATYNLATGKTGRHLSSDYPFMGSRNFEDAFNIPERTGNPTDFWSEIGGEFLLPTGQGLARSALKAEEFLSKIVKDKLPEVVGKNVPELFKTPITGLNIKPKDSALSPNLTKQAPKVDLSMRRQTNDFIDAMENDDLIFVGGVPSGNSRAGEIRRRYVVFDAKDKSKQLGEFEVFTDDKTNNFLGLVELKVKDKRKGTGKKIIDSLMQSDFVNDDFRIHSVLKASIPFWKKMGTKFPEEDLRKFEKMKGHVRDKAIPLGIISKHSPK
tara:strand:- start:11481 stop:12470 length:990 start_codon:yes stop_codon:yes gene_type:complete